MSAAEPWSAKETFAAVMKVCGSWSEMARSFTESGSSVSESTIRRWAKKHGLYEDYLSDRLDAAKAEAKELREVKEELEREIERVKKEPRKVKPRELIQAEKELSRARAAASQYKKMVKESSARENMLDEVRDLIIPSVEDLVIPAPKAKPPKPPKDTSESVSLVLSINDMHWGELIDSRTVNGLNAYSPTIAAKRLEHVVDVTRAWIDNYNSLGGVEEVVVLLNGDNFSGMHNLHPDEAVEYARIAKQSADSALVIAQAIAELAADAPSVRVVVPAGDNHTRGTKKNATSAVALGTSWSSMHHELIASLLRNQSNVSMKIYPSYQAFFDVQGRTWAACHGHALRGGGGALGIPAYSLKKLLDATVQKTLTMQNVDWLDELFGEDAPNIGIAKHLIIGHFHQQFMAQFNGGDVRIAPSLKGADAYSLDQLSKYNPAGQTLMVVHPRHDIVADHAINVQHIMNEDGGSRYEWGALEGVDTAVEIYDNWLETTGTA